MPDHKDPQDFAWALYTSDNYEEASNKLDCSVGTISVWKKKHGDKLDEFDQSDFTEKKPDPDEVEQGIIETNIREAYPYELEKDGSRLKHSTFGFVVDPDYSVSDIAGSDLNPFVAISEHQLTDDWIEKCDENDVGLIVSSEDSIEVPVDASVVFGSGMRPLLTPDKTLDHVKYKSSAWMEHAISNDYSVVDIAKECSLLPRSVRSVMDEFGLDTA